jgi:Fe-S-cluster containining protein
MAQKTAPPIPPETVMEHYMEMNNEIDRDVHRLREAHGGSPCPPTCFECCRNTATMAISEVEGQHLKEGLRQLPKAVQAHIFKKATRSIEKLEQSGYTSENITADSGMNAIDALKGKPEAECPLLIGGVCSVYEHRPVICRVWGYPINNGSDLACCKKTFIGQRRLFKPIDYSGYWRECRDLSESLGAKQKTPNCYLVVRLLAEVGRDKSTTSAE